MVTSICNCSSNSTPSVHSKFKTKYCANNGTNWARRCVCFVPVDIQQSHILKYSMNNYVRIVSEKFPYASANDAHSFSTEKFASRMWFNINVFIKLLIIEQALFLHSYGETMLRRRTSVVKIADLFYGSLYLIWCDAIQRDSLKAALNGTFWLGWKSAHFCLKSVGLVQRFRFWFVVFLVFGVSSGIIFHF